jgi:hypothetical protein
MAHASGVRPIHEVAQSPVSKTTPSQDNETMNKPLLTLVALAFAAPLALAPEAQARTCYSWDMSAYCLQQLHASVNSTKVDVPVASSWRKVVPQGQYFTDAEENAVARITERSNGYNIRATSARSGIDRVCAPVLPGLIGCSNSLQAWVDSEIRAEQYDSHKRWYDTANGKAYFDTRVELERQLDNRRAEAASHCRSVIRRNGDFEACMRALGEW